jgi:hypothetical protein
LRLAIYLANLLNRIIYLPYRTLFALIGLDLNACGRMLSVRLVCKFQAASTAKPKG